MRGPATNKQLKRSFFFKLFGVKKAKYKLRGKNRRTARVYFKPFKPKMPLYDLLSFPSNSKVIINEENGKFTWTLPLEMEGTK